MRQVRRTLSPLVALLICSSGGVLQLQAVAADGGFPAGLLKYEEIAAPLSVSQIPGLKLKSPERCFFFALQYGVKASEVAYVVLDAHPRKGEFVKLNVFVAAHRDYGKPLVIRGRRDQSLMRFKAFSVDTKLGDVDAAFDIHVEAEKHIVRAVVKCQMVRKGEPVSEFSLLYTIGSGAEAVTQPAKIIRVLEAPEVRFNLDNRSNPPKLAGRLKMGKWRFLPRSTKQSKVTLLIYDKRQEVRLTRAMGLQQSSDGQFRMNLLRRLKTGLQYDAEVVVDLGSFFGVVKAKKRIVP